MLLLIMKISFSFKKLFLIVGSLLAIITLFAGAGFLIFSLTPSQPEASFLEKAKMDSEVTISETIEYIEILPKDRLLTKGFIFYPGGRVDPHSYMYRFVGIAKKIQMPVYIMKMPLNYAFFNYSAADIVIKLKPTITSWYLSGHSLGGAMACEFVRTDGSKVKEVFLMASYCASDITKTKVPVVSMVGSNDGLVTEEKFTNYNKNLPDSAVIIRIPGMVHAQWGNYGLQDGDNKPTVADDVIQSVIETSIKENLK